MGEPHGFPKEKKVACVLTIQSLPVPFFPDRRNQALALIDPRPADGGRGFECNGDFSPNVDDIIVVVSGDDVTRTTLFFLFAAFVPISGFVIAQSPSAEVPEQSFIATIQAEPPATKKAKRATRLRWVPNCSSLCI